MALALPRPSTPTFPSSSAYSFSPCSTPPLHASRHPSRVASPALQQPPAPTPFRLHDLASELQLLIFQNIEDLPVADLAAAARVSRDWNTALTPPLYRSLSLCKATRQAVFAGLGLDYLSASALESRASEAGGMGAYAAPPPNSKAASLAHVRSLTLTDQAGALALAEALLTHGRPLFPALDELSLAAPVFRHLVNSGLAAFGRPRSGSAFVGETLVAHLRPQRLRIHYPYSPSTRGIFDPVLLARVLAVLHIEWAPAEVEYFGIRSDLPPVLGPVTRIHCVPCARPYDAECQYTRERERYISDGVGCAAHGALVRMHLRTVFNMHARRELFEAIEEGADPTDEDDLDPELLPEWTGRVEYHGVPCIAGAEVDAFMDKTFTHWPVEEGVDVAARVQFFA